MAPPITYNSGSTYTINWKLNPLPETSSLSGITGPDQPSRTEGRLSPASPSTILSPLIDIPFPLQGASTEEKVQDEEVQKKVNSYTENRNLLNPSFNNADTPKTLMTGMSLDDYRLPSSPTNTNTEDSFSIRRKNILPEWIYLPSNEGKKHHKKHHHTGTKPVEKKGFPDKGADIKINKQVEARSESTQTPRNNKLEPNNIQPTFPITPKNVVNGSGKKKEGIPNKKENKSISLKILEIPLELFKLCWSIIKFLYDEPQN